MYPECFKGIGKLKNDEYDIKLDDNAKPVTHPIKKITLVLRG